MADSRPGQIADGKNRIWRYLSFYQMMSILERDSLYFTRIDQFEDPFEGSLPTKNSKDIEKLEKIGKSFTKYTFVNCWNMTENESAAMWNLYGDQGVAIQSTVNDLRNSINISKKGSELRKVEYIDYEQDEMPNGYKFGPYFHKRSSFSHENEVRLIYTDMPPQSGCEFEGEPPDDPSRDYLTLDKVQPDMLVTGQFHEVNVDKMINAIYINPSFGDTFKDLVSEVLERYGIKKEVHKSNLSKDPVY